MNNDVAAEGRTRQLNTSTNLPPFATHFPLRSALAAVCSPSPPCYHRRGQWSPTKNNYGFEDRSACIRGKRDNLPEGEGVNKYFELRLPSSAANPYLVLCAVVAAGLDGIRRKTKIVEGKATPKSLGEALDALEADPVVCEALGARFVKAYVAVKRAEIDEVKWRVTHEKTTLEEAYAEMYVEYV
jgi:glutamine synthetase